jgi:phosphatidylglycerol---prolipoprotein diacylglyceryl transferase
MRPILFNIFGFPVHSYGVMIVIAFLVGVWLARRRAARFGLEAQKLTDGLIACLIIGIIGARVAYILQELPYYLKNPRELVTLQMAGVTSFGAIFAGMIFLYYWAKRRQVSPLTVFDCIGPPFLVANAIGRVGCLLNGCCYGGVCSATLPWKIRVAEDLGNWHHPAQIYDSLLNLIALAIIIPLERRNTAKGQTMAMALAGYGLSRFIYEIWRGGTDAQVRAYEASSTYWIGKLTQAQAVALVMVIAGGVLYFALARHAQANTTAKADVAPA